MRTLCIAVITLFASACAMDGAKTNSAHVLVGGKQFSDDLEPLETQPMVGVEFVVHNVGLGAEVGANYAKDQVTESGTRTRSESFEFYAGPRYSFEFGRWRPYLSAGVSTQQTKADVNPSGGPEVSDDTTRVGAYAGVGFDVTVWDALLGFSIRRTFLQDITVFGADTDAASTQFYVRAGFAF